VQETISLPWVQVAGKAPYFETEAGQPWTPVGQNDAITWPELAGCYRRRDLASVDRYLGMLARHGVTVLRLMLEYAQDDDHYFEQPAGAPRAAMVELWDDLFELCGRHGLRILLTPFDTYWMRVRTGQHPYMRENGGPCAGGSELLYCAGARRAIKERLAFVTRRWGASGTLFAWDLWNEIHPVQARGSAEIFDEFVADLSTYLRALEIEIHGRAHPQTVSFFLPDMRLDPRIADTIFRHPSLDFASPHFYEEGTIDYPRNTIDAAVAVGRIMRHSIGELRDRRPIFDSEHGPIHGFNDRHITLAARFDDEYFQHMQWAHLASGGAGGGMRWPYRHPHSLTPGMRAAQRGLAGFLELIDWTKFDRRNLNQEVTVPDAPFHVFASGDGAQAVIWLLRDESVSEDGTVDRSARPLSPYIRMPGLERGRYRVSAWDTGAGKLAAEFEIAHTGATDAAIRVPGVVSDTALAIRRIG
jgi:hypothetical protein